MNPEPAAHSPAAAVPFGRTLARNHLQLTRTATTVLQINVGLVCNQACRHCHLECGPSRSEMMDEETAAVAAEYARRGGFATVDVTGGAPELNPHIGGLVDRLSRIGARLIFRANLTALGRPENRGLMELLADRGVVVTASFPSLAQAQAEAQRGSGVFEKSLSTLRDLNALGYGVEGSGLSLDLVSNPAGAFLPPSQQATETRFRRELSRKWGIVFNNLFTFANVPLGRFRDWLERSGNYESYMSRLAEGFNPCAVEGVMCRSQVSLAWDGILYDCDFNVAAGLPMGGRPTHARDMAGPPEPGSPIAFGDHCYTCTAGAGFT